MPAEITDRWTELPAALWEHAADLDLGLADIGFVTALWSCKWYADSPIKPSMATLAERLGVSTDTVSRHVRRLEPRGLLAVERAGAGKRAPVKGYDLTPLWEALAAVVRERGARLRVVPEVRESADQSSANLRMSSANLRIASANLRMEVRLKEVRQQKYDQ